MPLPYSNLRMNHWNPGASMPLILPINVVCNTDDEVLYEQIRSNSRLKRREWINVVPAHDKVALMCGSGPSIRDDIKLIREAQKAGAHIFAMNNCANLLDSYGIKPNYQVILDARAETADLIGPADDHLFASQVHPSLFAKVPRAKIWQLDVGPKTEELFPDDYPEYALIGGAASVGNTALCLAYAMGYRTMHLFGYDSSHKDNKGHALHQKINDGDPCAYVDFNGKSYLVSLTMKLQAEKFMQTSADLKALGASLTVHGSGLLPDMYRNPDKVAEVDKYTEMWNHPAYRQHSPGEELVGAFLDLVAERRGTLIDFGCGTGRAAAKLVAAGFAVTLTDLTENSRDEQVRNLPFQQVDVTLPMHLKADFGYCTDVLEHLPPEQVKSAIYNITQSAKRTFFCISTVHDEMGSLIGRPLHLTVRPGEWWHELIIQLGLKVLHWETHATYVLFMVDRIQEAA